MSGTLRNAADFDRAAAAGLKTLYPRQLKILVGSASCGVAMGAADVEEAARRAVEELGLDAIICRTGCIGFCAQEPLLDLVLPDGPRVSYPQMTPRKTRELLEAYSTGNLKPELALGRFAGEEIVSTGEIRTDPTCPGPLQQVPEWSNLDFYRRQKKVILRNCGSIDPRALDETIARGTGSPLREFLYADDLARACVFLLGNYSEEQFINVGSGREVSI
ncbi:MAG TPA: NAD-dependent epimerase/dehydratase family protein, partial [Candidatus Deferrimicrobiaceae bacterium]